MYHKKFYHGIMFHYFHGKGIHKKSQGSIDKNNLNKIIKKIGRSNILNADEFLNRHIEHKLKNSDVCFTFDDGLKSQYDIALPVLEEHKIKSFFFVNTSIYTNEYNYTELFRLFRNNYFKDINEFYRKFFSLVDKNLDLFFESEINNIRNAKLKFPYYSINDLKFRAVRDKMLSNSEYQTIHFQMFKTKKFEYKKYQSMLYLSKQNLIQLNKLGHLVGLHSHSHSHKIETLLLKDQMKDYKKNLLILSKILNKKNNQINYMSHPNGSYTPGTLKILKKLGIKFGFKQIMSIEKNKNMKKINNSSLEIARNPHNNLIAK